MIMNELWIVDDDPIVLFGTKRLLEMHSGFRSVINFYSAIEAINTLIEREKTSKSLPDIILLDINMPDINGWDFLDLLEGKIIEEKLPNIYIHSSSNNNDDLSRSKRYKEVIGYILKPISFDIICEHGWKKVE